MNGLQVIFCIWVVVTGVLLIVSCYKYWQVHKANSTRPRIKVDGCGYIYLDEGE